jgi:hypothetical protein
MKILDVTESENLEKLKHEARAVNLYTSSISHEMLTPLKNVITVSGFIEQD